MVWKHYQQTKLCMYPIWLQRMLVVSNGRNPWYCNHYRKVATEATTALKYAALSKLENATYQDDIGLHLDDGLIVSGKLNGQQTN